MRNVVSRGTGRPVAPFSFPDFHAVPAMSRWAQSYLRANLERKQAAVTLPAARPPIFAKSAKLLLSVSRIAPPKRHPPYAVPRLRPCCLQLVCQRILVREQPGADVTQGYDA